MLAHRVRGNPHFSQKDARSGHPDKQNQRQDQSQRQRARAPALHLGTPRLSSRFIHAGEADQAVAAVLRDWKHSRQKTGRPCVGRKGTVVCFPHPEQVAWVSTLA